MVSSHNKIWTSCAKDATVRIWDAKTRALLNVISGDKGKSVCFCVIDMGNILSYNTDKSIVIWNGESNRIMQELKSKNTDTVKLLQEVKRGVVWAAMDKSFASWKFKRAGDDSFVLVTRSRGYSIVAENEKERDEWVEAIYFAMSEDENNNQAFTAASADKIDSTRRSSFRDSQAILSKSDPGGNSY